MSSSLLLCKNKEPCLNQIVTCKEKWILYYSWQWLAQRLDQEAPKHFPKPNQKRSWSLFGGLLPIWSTTAFRILVKPLPLRNILSKSTAMPTVGIGQQKGAQFFSTTIPELLITPSMLQKLNELGYEVFPRPPYSSDLSPTNYHFFKHLNNFLPGRYFHKQQNAENVFQEIIKSWSPEGHTNVFLIGKIVLIVMVPILVNKDTPEPGYNDVKCTVQNHDYICSNLIFWILIHYQTNSLQIIFSPIPQVAFSFYWWYPLSYRSFIVLYNPTCRILVLLLVFLVQRSRDNVGYDGWLNEYMWHI